MRMGRLAEVLDGNQIVVTCSSGKNFEHWAILTDLVKIYANNEVIKIVPDKVRHKLCYRIFVYAETAKAIMDENIALADHLADNVESHTFDSDETYIKALMSDEDEELIVSEQ